MERPADVHVVDFIAGLLEDWLLQEINIKRTRIDLELHLATLRDPVLAAFMRLQSASLIEHLSAWLKRLLRGHTDTASSEHEFQARVFAVAAMCGGLHSRDDQRHGTQRHASAADPAGECVGHSQVGAGVIPKQHCPAIAGCAPASCQCAFNLPTTSMLAPLHEPWLPAKAG